MIDPQLKALAKTKGEMLTVALDDHEYGLKPMVRGRFERAHRRLVKAGEVSAQLVLRMSFRKNDGSQAIYVWYE